VVVLVAEFRGKSTPVQASRSSIQNFLDLDGRDNWTGKTATGWMDGRQPCKRANLADDNTEYAIECIVGTIPNGESCGQFFLFSKRTRALALTIVSTLEPHQRGMPRGDPIPNHMLVRLNACPPARYSLKIQSQRRFQQAPPYLGWTMRPDNDSPDWTMDDNTPPGSTLERSQNLAPKFCFGRRYEVRIQPSCQARRGGRRH
jgi:hypothetical protein